MSLPHAPSHSPAVALEESRQYCAQLTKQQARNFYYGLKLLPQQKRQAMFALYAYMRLVDDIADGQQGQDTQSRAQALDVWSRHTRAALAGAPTDGHPVWPAFAEMVRRHGVPEHIFTDVIAGQHQDLLKPEMQTFEELRQYCYRVAGVVGLASIYIWGFSGGDKTESLAIDRGIAFQLTNVLRDLREDATRGRTYLPSQELLAAGVSAAQLSTGEANGAFCSLMRQQIARAQNYYDQSAPLEDRISPDSRPTLVAMTRIYRGLLEKIAADPRRVLSERVSLSALTKARIAWQAMRAK